MRNFSPVSEMRNGQRSWDAFWRQIRETKETWRRTKIITFAPFIASATLKAVSLRLNGTLFMWKIQQARQDVANRTARIHHAFIPVTGLKCSYGKISSPFTEISGTKPARPLLWTQQKFYNGFRGRARSRKPGQPGQPGSYEEALSVAIKFVSVRSS